MKLNEIKSAIEEWEGKLREAQANFDSAEEWEDECYNRVVLYEEECDAHPESEYLSDVLINEVIPIMMMQTRRGKKLRIGWKEPKELWKL